MFKRYGKNPYETESEREMSSQSTTRATHTSQGTTSDRTAHSQQGSSSFTASPSLESNTATATLPPRIFEDSQKNTSSQGINVDFEDLSQDPWDDKISSLPSAPSLDSMGLEAEEPETVLGEGVSFKGELKFERCLRIDGHFEGELISEGRLVVGPKGVVKSNIRMHEVIVEGYVEGNMVVNDRVELRGDARVFGDIQAKTLSIDEGVTVVGMLCVNAGEGKDGPKQAEESSTSSTDES